MMTMESPVGARRRAVHASDATHSAPMLGVDGLCVSYQGRRVLEGVDLDVEPGEFVALLGSSGCGKTTLLRAIAGFVPVDHGRIVVSGHDCTHMPPERRGMAMVFQSYALWPHMTVAANIGYGLRVQRRTRADIDARVNEILGLLDLEGLGERKTTELSGGQRQRVALGRALAVDPSILLLDEPLSNLDARVREQVRHEIQMLQRRLGITTIHVTHDREEAMVMADRIALMHGGRIVQVDAPEAVFNRPESPFVAAFMGARHVVELSARREGPDLVVEAASRHCPTRLRVEALPRPAHCPEGPVRAHFRGESAALAPAGTADVFDGLRLYGEVKQVSYPGGVHRHAVAVGRQEYLIDDERRFDVGTAVEVRLPPGALHMFARDAR